MKYCPECQVTIRSNGERCPLCHAQVTDVEGSASSPSFPSYAKFRDRRKRLTTAASIAAPAIIAASVLINVLTWDGLLWSLIVAAAALYAWLVGLYTFRRTDHIGQKLMLHAIGLSLLMVVINFVTSSPSLTSSEFLNGFSGIARWSLDYAIPSILIAFILAINIAMLTQRHRLRDYLIAQFSLCVIGFIPFVLIMLDICGIDTLGSLFMSITASSLSLATLALLIVFARRLVAKEFGRRFHI